MGIFRFPDIDDYWRKDGYVFEYPNKYKGLSKNLFKDIHSKIYIKYDLFINQMNKSFQKFMKIGSIATSKTFIILKKLVDETRIAAHHKTCKFLQYNKQKPEVWAIEIITICLENKYLYALSQPHYNEKKGGSTPIDLAKKLILNYKIPKFVELVMDTHFFSEAMIEWLNNNQYKYIISIPTNHFSEIFKKKLHVQLSNGRTHAAKFNNYIYTSTDSRKIINHITNIFDVEQGQNVTKNETRKVLNFYDEHKKNVDNFNLLNGEYMSKHKHDDYIGTLFDGLVQMIITNCFIIFKEKYDNNANHKDFLLSLANSLITNKFK